MTLTCIHAESGLCPDCQQEFDFDPVAYIDYGDHPEGIERWAEVQKLMNEVTQYTGYSVPSHTDPDPAIPF